jgi:hypothetical protein
MKTLLVVLLLALSVNAIGEGKKFQVTFTVTYNSMTLEQAAKKEQVFRDLFKDACTVDVSVKEAAPFVSMGSEMVPHSFADTVGLGVSLSGRLVPNYSTDSVRYAPSTTLELRRIDEPDSVWWLHGKKP